MSNFCKILTGFAGVVLLAGLASAATVAASAPTTLDARPFFPMESSPIPLSCDSGGMFIILR